MKERDAGRSRRLILGGATRLFAERGYDATTIEQIADAAGLSRGAPRYFFGSKERLYRQVLVETFGEIQRLLEEVTTEARGRGLEAFLELAVDRFIDLLLDRPHVVMLLERESLRGDLLGSFPPNVDLLAAAAEAVGGDMAVSESGLDPALIVIAGIALCQFPVAHVELLVALGVDPAGREFRARLKRHATGILLHGVLG